MEMVHPYSNFHNNYNNYGNFNHHQNDKYHHQLNNYDNRPYKSNINKNVDTSKFQFTNLIKNNNYKNNNDNSSNQEELDKTDSIEFKPGMQDVPQWLKSLRLHKYKLIFSELSYEEMLALTEQQLEQKNVTKGARHKIIVNIEKLRARQSNVIGMEKSIEHEGISGIKQSLNELKVMLVTPIKAYNADKDVKFKDIVNKETIDEGDLPGQIMSFIDKVFNYIQPDTMRDEEIINLYLQNVDKCISHEAFGAYQKSRLIKIKAKIETSKGVNSFYKNDKFSKMKWNNNQQMPLNSYKNGSNNSLNNYHNYMNGFNNQYTPFNNNQNSSLNNLSQNFHPYSNNQKFNSSNYSSSSNQSSQNFYPKNGHQLKQQSNLVLSHNSSINQYQNQKMNFNLNKLNSNENHKFNVNAECFQSSKNLNDYNSNKLSINENFYSSNDNSVNKFRGNDLYNNEFDKQISKSNNNDLANSKILTPLNSCSLFNACSQIGKFTSKINSQFNSFDKLNNLDSNCLKQNNQFIISNIFDDNSLMKCLENDSSLANSNIIDHQTLESKLYDDFDDKLDENHQIYNHIELLSLRMTEHALGG